MALVKKIPALLDHIEKNKKTISYNNELFNIMEGDLLTILVEHITKIAASKSTQIGVDRAAPINVLVKVVSKLAAVYREAPCRSTENPSDMDIIKTYEQNGINDTFQDNNTNYNTYKNSTNEIYYDPKIMQLRFRSVPSMQFLPYSDDEIDPLRMTELIKVMNPYIDNEGNELQKYHVYSDKEFISIDERGTIVKSDMELNKGQNVYGVIPFPYINKSRNLLIPKIDTDQLRMTILVALLITDINWASKFLSNPIMYGIDIDQDNFELSPNIFWNVKSDLNGNRPELGVLKAEPDIEGQLNLIKNQLGMWLETKNIKPGAIGKLTADNYSSGIAMMLSEMDTANEIRRQQKVYEKYEVGFWQTLAQIHNYLAQRGFIKDRRLFTDPTRLIVQTEFKEMKPFESHAEKLERVKKEVEAGLKSKRRAIKELNPKMSDDEVSELLEEIRIEEMGDLIQGEE
jgi:hypothetical protein